MMCCSVMVLKKLGSELREQFLDVIDYLGRQEGMQVLLPSPGSPARARPTLITAPSVGTSIARSLGPIFKHLVCSLRHTHCFARWHHSSQPRAKWFVAAGQWHRPVPQVVVEPSELDVARSHPAACEFVDTFAPGEEDGCAAR